MCAVSACSYLPFCIYVCSPSRPLPPEINRVSYDADGNCFNYKDAVAAKSSSNLNSLALPLSWSIDEGLGATITKAAFDAKTAIADMDLVGGCRHTVSVLVALLPCWRLTAVLKERFARGCGVSGWLCEQCSCVPSTDSHEGDFSSCPPPLLSFRGMPPAASVLHFNKFGKGFCKKVRHPVPSCPSNKLALSSPDLTFHVYVWSTNSGRHLP